MKIEKETYICSVHFFKIYLLEKENQKSNEKKNYEWKFPFRTWIVIPIQIGSYFSSFETKQKVTLVWHPPGMEFPFIFFLFFSTLMASHRREKVTCVGKLMKREETLCCSAVTTQPSLLNWSPTREGLPLAASDWNTLQSRFLYF